MSVPPSLAAGLASCSWKLVASPVIRTGAALLIGGALLSAMPAPSAPSGYRLTLATDSEANCYYGSAWNDGDVVLPHDASDGKIVTLSGRYDFEDGCTWEVTEILTPQGSGYTYQYVEHYGTCEDDATPARACSRHGRVSVTPIE